jgi:ABC-2 type transport system ATP-binding protein
MHDPDLLILDEPTSGLDPLVQNEFHRLLRELADRGKTIFLSSHVLSEIEVIAHRVGIIRAGELVAVEALADLKAKATRRVDVVFRDPPSVGDLTAIEGVREAHIEDARAHFVVDGSMDALVKSLARYEVLDLVSQEPDLEEIFLAYYEEPDA